MGFVTPIGMVGDKLIVGAIDTSFLASVTSVTPGTTVLNGPVYAGAAFGIGVARATVMIGPPLSVSLPASLEVTGITNIFGVLNVISVSTFTGLTTKLGTTIKNALSLKNGIDIKNALNIGNAAGVDNGIRTVNGILIVNGILKANGTISTPAITAAFGAFASVAAPFKQFDIPHPTKPGYRLRHTCLEGPEIGVYCRGVLEGKDVIELPDYWRGLVRQGSITVNLTPKEIYQELYYEIIDWGTKIKVKNNASAPVNCSYTVYGERKDIERIQVEYEGEEINNGV